MKRRFVALIISSMLALVACSGNASEQATVNNASNESSEVISEVADEASTDISVQSEDEENTSLYKSFLQNEAKVHISTNNNFGYYYNFEDMQDQEFTLEELVNRIIDGYVESPDSGVKIELEKIEYAYIDCGNDGKEELAIVIYTPTYAEGWTEYIIIRENNGLLETIFSDVAWSRSRICLNKYGYFYNDGSGGASHHGFDKSYIDADGKYHFIYSNSSDGFYDETNGEYVVLGFDFNNTIDDETDDVYTYAILDDAEDNEYEWNHGFRDFFYAPLKDDDSIYEDSSPIKQLVMQNMELDWQRVYPIKEIKKMISEKESQEGLSDLVKNGEDPEWKELDVPFEPYIASFNDNNIFGINEFFPLGFTLCAETNAGVGLRLEANGEFSSSYHFSNYKTNPDYISYQNECIGKFEVVNKENDHTYKLKVTYFALVNVPGTQEVMDGALGSKIIKNYVDIPGFDDDGTEYLLYCPGTSVEEIGEDIINLFPEYYKEEHIVDGALNKYLLLETDGKHYVWRDSSY